MVYFLGKKCNVDLVAKLIVFIIFLLCVTLSKFRSWSRVRKKSQEDPITPKAHRDIDQNNFIIGRRQVLK